MPEKFGACCDGVTEFVEEEQLMSPTWICAKCSALSNAVSLSPNWREMDLTDGTLHGFKSWGQGLKWRPVTSIVLQGLALGLMLLNIFVMVGVDAEEKGGTIQRDLGRLERWGCVNLMNFNTA